TDTGVRIRVVVRPIDHAAYGGIHLWFIFGCKSNILYANTLMKNIFDGLTPVFFPVFKQYYAFTLCRFAPVFRSRVTHKVSTP
ncbi:hypothetical protein, partial [uncultured Bacteroides sp.]